MAGFRLSLASRVSSVPQVRRTSLRRVGVALLLSVCAGFVPAPSAHAQTTADCEDDSATTPESFGPTDVNAVSGNGKLSAGFNADGTLTVLKWPSPSFYDQIRYRTTDRSAPRMGAAPNEGSFLGVAWRRGGARRWTFSWLRTWRNQQRFTSADGDAIMTRYADADSGLVATVRDVVAHDRDVLVRHVDLQRKPGSPAARTRVVAFVNFNPVFSKTQNSPTDDWCTEEDNDDGARFSRNTDAIVAERSGTDASTGEGSSVGLAMGFARPSTQHQVGSDVYATGDEGVSAYDDAEDGRLRGDRVVTGQSDAALSRNVSPDGAVTLLFAAAPSGDAALDKLVAARRRSAGTFIRTKNAWWKRWQEGTRIPDGPAPVVRLAKRALITVRQNTARSGLIVTSIATQAPLGLDWVRDGAYINRMLDSAGKSGVVTRHNVRYAGLQATTVDKPPGASSTPAGNWAQNHYSDGVAGGTIPYAIDTTGLGIWTLWDHFAHTGDRGYLLDVYEAIQRAAHYLTDDPPLGCRDPATGLQCTANEGDNETPTRTLVGAQAAWLGLDAAARAATALNTETSLANAERWRTRRDELAAAIRANFFDQDCRCYSRDYRVGGTNLWPVGFERYDSGRSENQAEMNMRALARAMNDDRRRGGMESLAVLGNAYEWAGERKERKLERALRWIATTPTTQGTGLLGGAWMHYPKAGSPIVTMLSQPHAWAQAAYYLAAAKVYGTRRWR